MKLKKGDTVTILSGKDRGKTGKIEKVYTKIDKVSVAGINILKKHTRARGSKTKQAGIIEFAGPLPAARVMLICPKCSRPARIGAKVSARGKERVCRKCKEAID